MIRINTLFSKLLVRFILIALIIIIVLGFSMIYFFRNFYFAKKEEEIINNTQTVNNYIAGALTERNMPEVRSWLKIVAKMNEGQAWLVNPKGYLTLSYPPVPHRGKRIKFSRYQEIFAGKTVTRRVKADYFEEPMLLTGLPIRTNGQTESGLLIFTPVAGIKATVNHVIKLMFYSSLFAIILAIFVAYSWSKSLSNPLKRISDFALDLSRADFGKTINIEKMKEIEEINSLGESINNMSLTLEETIENLVEQRNKLKYVLSGMEEGVLAVNKDREIILINQSARSLFNLKEKELIGKGINKFIEKRQIINLFNKVLENKKILKDELFIQENEMQKRVLVHLTPIFTEEDQFWGVAGLFQDISERWRFEQLQKEFVANVSHDLKAPLSSIRGSTELLLDGIVDTQEKRQKYLEMIFAESQRLENLVKEILALDEFDTRVSAVSMERVEVNELLNSVKMVFGKIMDRSDFDLKLIMPEQKLCVKANREKLKQVLINLLDNAVKFSSGKGKIELGAAKEDDKIKFWVSDNGKGIQAQELENIWERFYKIDEARTPGEAGSGLGLAIVKQIVEEHEGKVFVESKVNQGSTFGFYLNDFKKTQ